jgi:endoglucanase
LRNGPITRTAKKYKFPFRERIIMNLPSWKLLFIPVIIVLLVISSRSTPGFLHASGQQIVDSSGVPILLKGYGLGGWLVPEGYMLHTPGYGSPTYIDSLIRDLIGSRNADVFWQNYRANYVREADIETIAGWGFNSIRLPFHYRVFYDVNSQNFLPEGFALLDTLLQWCGANNLYLILDMHCAPGGQNKDNISDSDGIEARLWTEPALYQPLTVRIWKEIARRYVNDTRIGGYDLLNEPVLPTGYNNQVLRDFYVQLTDSVRTIDQNHLIFIEGNWYATDFNLLTPTWDSNMAYSFHKYWNATTIGTIQYLMDIRSQYNVPLWMGESGENSNPWFYEAVQLFNANQIGWCWWAHKKIATITSPLSAILTAEYQTLLNYWNGQGARPSQSYANSALLQIAENLRIENCETRPGVIKALMDPQFGNTPQPFTPLTIPGTIPAVHYDYGTVSVGYADADFKNINGPGGAQWNNGWEYRNDGVDIEPSRDPQGYPYNVGWIDDNEWLRFTVNISGAGIYRADIRVASASGGGVLRIYVDNQPVTPNVYMPNTGGWQTWQSVPVQDITLPAGIHQLIFSFPTGGFNLNQISFTLVSSSIENGDAEIPRNYQLEQNYPNPFNSWTRINYYLPRTEFVNLTVYDSSGKEVKVLINEQKSSGQHSISFESGSLSSGIYVVKLQAGHADLARKMLLIK